MYEASSQIPLAPPKQRNKTEYQQDTHNENIRKHFPQKGKIFINRFTCIIDKLKEHYLVATIVFGSILLVCLLIPIIIMYAQTANEDNIIQKSNMIITLPSGNRFTSQIYSFENNDKFYSISINTITPTKARFLQESDLSQIMEINYYHKVTQISASIGTNMKMHTRIPGDTGMDYVISNVPPQSQSALQKMPSYLPQALSSSLEEVMGKTVTITTACSHDGVYNNKTKEYRLLTVNNSYHPDEFAQIAPNEINFCDANPKVSNFSDIVEVTNKIAQIVASIVRNLKQAIINNKVKVEKIVGDINVKQSDSIHENSLINSQEKAITKCTRVGPQILRCPDDVWKSGQLKVSNIEAPNLVEVWEIVAETQ